MKTQGATFPNVRSVLNIICLAGTLATASCMLETRDDQEEKHVMQKQVQTLQRTNADVNQKFSDTDEELRRTNGRVEVTDNNVRQLDQKIDRNNVAIEAKMREIQEKLQNYHEAIAKLEQGVNDANSQIQQLTQQMTEAQKLRAGAGPASISSGKGKANAYPAAEELFNKKDFKNAIPEYERYRKSYPDGKHWRDATYKIGVSFQEMGMPDEARAFYDELVAKSGGSAEAKKAASRLKSMTKKP